MLSALFKNIKRITCLLLLSTFTFQNASAQNIEAQSVLYNGLIGAVSGGVGAVINKHKGQKWYKAFTKGFIVGSGGGVLMYSGKRINSLISVRQNLEYGYLSRLVYDAGNSIVENAAANRNFWEVWHYDVGFIRLELQTKQLKLRPKIMASSFGGTIFLAFYGNFDARTSLLSGTPIFRTKEIKYSPTLIGSTVTNGFLLNDTLRKGNLFYDVFSHEMVHTFQFSEFNGFNYFFNPLKARWSDKAKWYAKANKWIYGDLSYELFMFNYFIIQRGSKGTNYCNNFLENEAEYLSTERSACDFKAH